MNEAKIEKGIVSIGSFEGHYTQFVPEKRKVKRQYQFPDFIREVECILLCGSKWEDYRSSNVMLTGPHGCVIGDTKIKIRKISEEKGTPIKIVLD